MKKRNLRAVATKDKVNASFEGAESLTSAMSCRVFGNPLRPHCFKSPRAFIGPRSLPPLPLLLAPPMLFPLPFVLLFPVAVPVEDGFTAVVPLAPPLAPPPPPPPAFGLPAPVAPGVVGVEARFGEKSHRVTRSECKCGRYLAASQRAAPSCSPVC